ncbi:AfsR/SARP family transcriptional regulator [Actinoplanes sp. N902-109]|uniref:AfsR/SARP family transcriptional regulator n=1 Tax=Actinoplanes sp. (strain N902-109) TaxID=649831 RepID=UPI0003295B4D|nr:AfsR/SARP family transcriptional regulator [Actinoplanes sp. N902-109]AGL20664.1 putative transcription activator [Actinoplanes sp. N902-109]
MRFCILGPIQLVDGTGSAVNLPQKVSQLLALLLLRTGQVVELSQLVDELWEEAPPPGAELTTRKYAYELRRALLRSGVDAALETRAPGYLLRADPSDIDAVQFERLHWRVREHLLGGEPKQAAQLCQQALAMWRGHPMADVTAGPLLRGHAARLAEVRTFLLQDRITAALELGCHREALSELRRLVEVYPLDEWFHAQLIYALDLCGRRADALEAYQRVRRLLDDDLGVEPSVELQRLQHDVLTGARRRPFRIVPEREVPVLFRPALLAS